MQKEKMTVVVWLGAIAISLLLPVGAMAQGPTVDLSPYPGPYGGELIEVTSPDVEPLWIHFNFTQGELWHINDIEVKSELLSGGGNVDPGPWEEIGPSQYPEFCVWYLLCYITVTGEYCDYIDISVDVTFQLPTGTVSSNTIHKHIIPEPSSLLVLSTGVFGLLMRRRRRS